MRLEEFYTGSPGSVATARNAVRTFLTLWSTATDVPIPDAAAGAALLVVSELVSNAIRHADGLCVLRLVAAPDRLEIEVEDSSRAPIAVLGTDPHRIGGHGLEIVSALSATLTVEPNPAGKRVRVLVPLTD